ncbi:MAG: group 1 truncated hemoglobin [Phycisphaerae bacterium]
MTQTLTTSLFERLGGHAAIQHVVAEFCNRLLADENLAGFFAWTNMDLLARSQVQFLTTALGGPGDYHGRSLKDAHARRDITTVGTPSPEVTVSICRVP